MAIPSHAKKVFTGKLHEVYQWDQELFDGSTTTFEGLRRVSGVQVLATRDGKVLVTREEQPSKPPFCGFIGGHIEDGEAPEVAAARELLEETGLHSDDWVLVRRYDWKGTTHFSTHFYIARECVIAAKPRLDPGERITVLALSFDEFMDLLSSDEFRPSEVVVDILRREHNGTLAAFRDLLFPKQDGYA